VLIQKDNDYTKDDAADDDGNSYKLIDAEAKVKESFKTKVRWYNSQIRAWEEILMNN
jgi:hypothetical protein